VCLLDVVTHDATALVPDLPFSEIRRGIGSAATSRRRSQGVPGAEVRSARSPPRRVPRYATPSACSIADGPFEPMQAWRSAAWAPPAARCLHLHRGGLRRMGIPPRASSAIMTRSPGAWASAARRTTTLGRVLRRRGGAHRPRDRSSEALLRRYQRRDAFRAGPARPTPLAIPSRDLGDRRANPYHDMDFWSESRRSVFRPLPVEGREASELQPPHGAAGAGLRVPRRRGGTRSLPRSPLGRRRGLLGSASRTVRRRHQLGAARAALPGTRERARADPVQSVSLLPCVCLPILGRPRRSAPTLSQLVTIYRPAGLPTTSCPCSSETPLAAALRSSRRSAAAWAGLQVVRLLSRPAGRGTAPPTPRRRRPCGSAAG
jgi:hypothetical protein